MSPNLFKNLFKEATGNEPFPWQEKLYDEFLREEFPKLCDIPTGLGKTSIIAIWLITLANHAQSGSVSGFPRRLVYVVNRRTVVDQATREAEHLRDTFIRKPSLQTVAEALRRIGTPEALSGLEQALFETGGAE